MRGVDGREYAAIFCGGFVGAIARVALVRTLPSGQIEWPWATFTANMLGAFLLGYFSTRLQERLPVSAYRRPLLGTGFCGALTTFSAFQLELLRMLDGQHIGLLLIYLSVSLGGGFLAIWWSTAMVRRVKVLR